jgi:valyl-tRNA synthetase
LSPQRIEGYRNFGTKLWNATRFAEMNGCVRMAGFDPATVKQPLNRWIRGEAAKMAADVTKALEDCAFDDVANGLYRFIWNVYCDWALELAKPILNGEDAAAKAETQATIAWVLDVCLKLLHPVMPFLTEELWAKTGEEGPAREGMLISAPWPELPLSYVDAEAEAEIGLVVAAVSEGRSVRAELNVPLSAKPPLLVIEATETQKAAFRGNAAVIAQTLRVSGVEFVPEAPQGSIPYVVEGATLALPVAEFIDLTAEKARLTKAIAGHAQDIERTEKKLGNADFVARAPEEVIEENRERLAEAVDAKVKLESALARLAAVG